MTSTPSLAEDDSQLPDSAAGEITDLLSAWEHGDLLAEAELFGKVYPRLERIASRRLARTPAPGSLETADLVHDTYLRLIDQRQSWRNGDHFFATVATLVRRVVGDHARQRRRQKRGSGAIHASLDDVEVAAPPPDLERLALHRGLLKLHSIDRTAARVVALRYFEGLCLEEVAEALAVGRATVVRAWNRARAFLGRSLGGGSD